MGSGVTSARSVRQLFLAGEFLFEFLVAAVLHFADVLEVVDFCVLLGHLVLEVFALGGVGLFGFNAAVQFLAEASILTFTGGMIGIILGLSLALLICKVIDFSFVVNPVLIVIVVAISTAIGLFFGIYPAKRAANLDPIEALRNE